MRDRRPAVPAACGDVFPHVAEALSLAPGNGAAVRHTQPHTRLKGAGCGSHLPALDRGPVSRAVGAPAPIGCGVPIGAVKCPLPCPKLPRLRFLPCNSAADAARPARMRRSRGRAAPCRPERADGRNIGDTTGVPRKRATWDAVKPTISQPNQPLKMHLIREVLEGAKTRARRRSWQPPAGWSAPTCWAGGSTHSLRIMSWSSRSPNRGRARRWLSAVAGPFQANQARPGWDGIRCQVGSPPLCSILT
jgi:hypothetical protein